MGSRDPFGHLKHKLWPKEGPLKVENRLDFLACRCHATYRWKALKKGYNLASNLISIRDLHVKLWAPKVTGVPVVRISRLPLEGPETKWHLGALLWLGTKYTIRGKVVASPKSGPWWVLWVCVCMWLICAPKCSNYALTNLLIGFCRSVWMIKMLVNLPSPIPKLQHAPLPPKCYKPGSTPRLLHLSLFIFGLAVESIKELRGASP
jgi:hypothetical protein